MSSSPPNPRPFLVPVIGLLVVLLLGGLAFGGRAIARHRYEQALLPLGSGPAQYFKLQHGETVGALGRRLQAAKLIRDAEAFRRRAGELKRSKQLQAGWYELSPAMSVDLILDAFAGGKVSRRKLTFPEGYTLDDMARRCEETGFCRADDYRQLARDQAASFHLQGLPAGASLEGYLFPATYQLPLDAGPRELIAQQLKQFVVTWRQVSAGAPPTRHTRHELVTIASLVEKEVKVDAERPMVAGVIENRLRRGMRLELDATVLYALGEHRDRLLYRDLQVASPYNTYKVAGLPPGPISNPGRASLAAAVRPAKHDYLYYVLGADGRHLFGRTAADHARNKAAAQKARQTL